MERPKYLVTGGAGFIGSHLVDALLARGEPVVALDDISTGSLVNLARAREQAHFQFVHGSVLDTSLVDELVSECDVVVHLAAAVGVKLIVEQPLNSFTINTKGTETVLSSAHRHGRMSHHCQHVGDLRQELVRTAERDFRPRPRQHLRPAVVLQHRQGGR